MKDGPLRRAVKALLRWPWELELRLRRARRRPLHVLAGECRLCARCCEDPSIQVGRLVWYLPRLRRAFVWWQRQVNGFELTGRLVEQRALVFRCTHFDPVTRRCDSYESRPGMCRDYPRLLLDQPAPAFLPGCGYRAVARNAEGLRRALENSGLPEEKLARLRRDLKLE